MLGARIARWLVEAGPPEPRDKSLLAGTPRDLEVPLHPTPFHPRPAPAGPAPIPRLPCTAPYFRFRTRQIGAPRRRPLRSVTGLSERLAKNAGPGPRGPDRLAHSLLDLLVDNYTPMLAELHTELEEIEEIVLSKDSDKTFVAELLQVRGDFTKLRQ